jgi:hypothetical protein
MLKGSETRESAEAEIGLDENILDQLLDGSGIAGETAHSAGDGGLMPLDDTPKSLAVAGEACGDIRAIGLVIHCGIFHRSLPIGHLREEIINRGIGLRPEVADLPFLLIGQDRGDLLLEFGRQHGGVADGMAEIIGSSANGFFIGNRSGDGFAKGAAFFNHRLNCGDDFRLMGDEDIADLLLLPGGEVELGAEDHPPADLAADEAKQRMIRREGGELRGVGVRSPDAEGEAADAKQSDGCEGEQKLACFHKNLL